MNEEALDVCRLCLEKLPSAGSIVPLRSNSFQAALNRVFPFELILGSALPEYACNLCSKWIWEFSSYSEFVENNQHKLERDYLFADNVQKNVKNQQQNSGSTNRDGRRARYEDSNVSSVEPFSSELGFNDSIEVGKYELQEVENDESDSFSDGIQLSEDEDEYEPAFSIENINQPHNGWKQDVQKKQQNSDSACESPSTMRSEASAGSAEVFFKPEDTADIRKHTFREPKLIDTIEIDDNELQELEREEMESANNVPVPKPITPMITEPEEALQQNSPKTNETKNQTTFSCGCCKETFTERRVLEKHFCRKALNDNTNTLGHRKNPPARIEVRVPCPICAGQIPRSHLKQHIRAHEGAFTCHMCGKKLSSPNRLKEHQKAIHTVEDHPKSSKNAQCPICSKRMLSKNLKVHIEAHKGAFRCNICGRNLFSADTLKNHKNTFHVDKTNQDPSRMKQCSICGKQVHRENFKRHVYGHEHTQCPICSKEIRSKNLNRHINRTHVDAFRCNICGQNFTSSYKLTHHLKAHSAQKN